MIGVTGLWAWKRAKNIACTLLFGNEVQRYQNTPALLCGIALATALRYVFAMEKQVSFNISKAPAPGQGHRCYADIPLNEKLNLLVDWLEEHKAQRIVSLDLAGQGDFTDTMLVCSAGSMRHAQSLADGVSAFCHERNFEYLRMEGYEVGQWILVDLNDVIIHIFIDSVRELYRLEELWERTPRKRESPCAEVEG